VLHLTFHSDERLDPQALGVTDVSRTYHNPQARTRVPIAIYDFANRNCTVENFVDGQPNVPCICHIFSEVFQNTNCKSRVVVA
jgi:hypothetical protein